MQKHAFASSRSRHSLGLKSQGHDILCQAILIRCIGLAIPNYEFNPILHEPFLGLFWIARHFEMVGYHLDQYHGNRLGEDEWQSLTVLRPTPGGLSIPCRVQG